MQAVVMAAGEGRRLRPLTERHPKPVLPIDGRPVIATLLRELANAGASPIAIVLGRLGDQVERLLAGFDRELRFVWQPEPVGSADAVLRAEFDPPYVVLGADTVFGRGDIARFLEAAAGFDGAVAVRCDPPPNPPHRHAVRIDADGLVTQVLDDDPENPLAGAPLWLVGQAVAARLSGLPGPPYELAGALQGAVDDGARIAAVEIGPTRDLTDPLDLMKENFGYLSAL